MVPMKDTEPARHQQHLKFTKYLFKDKLCQRQSAQLENMFRKMVREEVEHTIQRSPLIISRSFPSQIGPSESRPYKLQFEGNLPSTLFTGNKVQAAEGLSSPVKVLLLDAVSGHLITDSPLSSKRVEIVALQGHFKTEHLMDWSKNDFCTHIVSKRKNKGPLLIGDCMITLCNGVGFVNNVSFTDNSSWVRSKRFRLGARVVAEEDRVREAVSNAVQVKHCRGEAYQKHEIPSLDDEVWRLCWIAKDGKTYKKLEEKQIYKVKDFITYYQSNESSLRSIVNLSEKRWKEVIEHANSCYKGNDPFTILNNSSQINQNIVPSSSLQQICVNDQQVVQMPESYAGQHNHHLGDQDHSMGLDSYSLENLSIGSPKDVCLPSPCYTMPPLSPTMLDGLTSGWSPDQYLGEEMLSSIPNASDIANPDAGLEDIG